ncbi:glycosyltransferase [Desulfogranum japonicum]|uniref:glycosyltransferase n=1 Tax=Desulfogranum japonicum TaxID=231447 RepID=UPI00042604F5|nr:glycosyltransferase [Desulfogranum japonicum]
MRILFVGQTYFREDNGQAVFTVHLARGLARAGHQIMAVMPSPDETRGPTESGQIALWQVGAHHLPHNANITLMPGSSVKQAVTSFSPDIIHLQDHYFLCSAAFKVAKKLAIPVVATNHFLPDNITDNIKLPGALRRKTAALLWKHMLRIYNKVDAVTTPTETGVSILRQQQIIPPAQAISCGIDTLHFHPPSPEERRQGRELFHLQEDETVLVYVGRIDHEKGLDTVLDAFARLRGYNSHLILAGKGSYSKTLEIQRDALGIRNRVSMPGFVPGKDLPALLHSADCFVMAGHAELQSIATLEAMASGLPVLAANARALPELVGNFQNGFLFTPGDAQSLAEKMELFYTSKQQWPHWRAESRKRACLHDHEKTVQQYVEWYTGVIDSSLHN